MNLVNPFRPAEKLVGWSFESVDKASRARKEFADLDPVIPLQQSDTETRDVLYKFVQVLDPPTAIERELTSAMNNTRNAFDQALYAACVAIGKPVKDAHYPWVNSAEGLEQRLAGKGNRAPSIPQELWNEIRRQKPYRTGDASSGGVYDLTRDLALLANAKHRVGFGIGAQVLSSSISHVRMGGIAPMFASKTPMWDPQRREIVVARTNGDVTIGDIRIDWFIAFECEGDLNGHPAIPALKIFAERARDVVSGFKQACEQIRSRRA